MIYHRLAKKDEKKRLGYVHVYTGHGKGKTTAALGLALRALGHNLRTTIIQFLKGHKEAGEFKIQDKLSGLKVVQFGTGEPVDFKNPSAMDIYFAQQALDYARKIQAFDRPDILILDEINPVVHYKLLPLQEVIDFIDNKHRETELILTGRYAHPEILNHADLVTVMETVKHYFDQDFVARFGIEH